VDDHQVVLAAQFLDRAALGYHTVLPLITIAASAISPDPVSRMAAQNHPAYLPEVVLGADPEGAQAFGQRLQDEFGFVPALDHLSVPGLCATCTSSSG